jgi:hypothetical protein
MDIIRNCWHHSSIYTGIEYLDGRPSFIVKTSFSIDGVKDIVNEARGLSWYAGRLQIEPGAVYWLHCQGKGFGRLGIKFFSGTTASLGHSLVKNQGKIENALHYWFEHFGTAGVSHGDYSIDNILFDKDRVTWVTDWEHFTNQLPPWFDTMYCLVEACFFRHRYQGNLPADELRIYRRYCKEIADYFGLAVAITARPSQVLRFQLDKNSAVFDRQLSKYPFVNVDQATIEKLDDCLSQ